MVTMSLLLITFLLLPLFLLLLPFSLTPSSFIFSPFLSLSFPPPFPLWINDSISDASLPPSTTMTGSDVTNKLLSTHSLLTSAEKFESSSGGEGLNSLLSDLEGSTRPRSIKNPLSRQIQSKGDASIPSKGTQCTHILLFIL